MKIWPGAYDDGLRVGCSDKLPPLIIDGGNAKLVGHPLRGLAAAIAYADDFYAINGLQAWVCVWRPYWHRRRQCLPVKLHRS